MPALITKEPQSSKIGCKFCLPFWFPLSPKEGRVTYFHMMTKCRLSREQCLMTTKMLLPPLSPHSSWHWGAIRLRIEDIFLNSFVCWSAINTTLGVDKKWWATVKNITCDKKSLTTRHLNKTHGYLDDCSAIKELQAYLDNLAKNASSECCATYFFLRRCYRHWSIQNGDAVWKY